MTKCPYCLLPFLNVNPAHLIKHGKRLADVYDEFPGWDIGKTSKGAILGIPKSIEHRHKIGESQKGKVISLEQRKKQSEFMTGRPSARKGVKMTLEQRIRNSAAQQGIAVEDWTEFAYNGYNHWFSKSPDWRVLRLKVKYRDKFRCADCKKQFQGKELEVHHIIPRRDRNDLALEPTNCITLCKPCHRRINRNEYLHAGRYQKIIATL